MQDAVVIAVVLCIVGFAALYIYRAKKRGVHCIGCPNGGSSCHGRCSCQQES